MFVICICRWVYLFQRLTLSSSLASTTTDVVPSPTSSSWTLEMSDKSNSIHCTYLLLSSQCTDLIYSLSLQELSINIQLQWPPVITSSDITRYRLQRDDCVVPNYFFFISFLKNTVYNEIVYKETPYITR